MHLSVLVTGFSEEKEKKENPPYYQILKTGEFIKTSMKFHREYIFIYHYPRNTVFTNTQKFNQASYNLLLY